MNNINFMQEKALNFGIEKVVVSKNVKDEKNQEIEWELKKLSFVEIEELLLGCKGRNDKINYIKSIYKLMAESVVKPDLSDRELQSKYGVDCREMLLRVMLTPDEYGELLKKIKSMYIN